MYGNFQFKEFITTSTGLLNHPTSPDDLVNIARLWNYLASIREELGHAIIVNSAFRTSQVNEQVGGTKCSYHMRGRAADIYTHSLYMDTLHKLLSRDRKSGKLAEFLIYPTFFHIAL